MSTLSLPRSLDVVINITKASLETATDMSIGCLLTKEAKPSGWGVSQILAYYSDFTTMQEDWAADTDVYKAGEAFFSQSPRPAQLAVGLVTGTIDGTNTIATYAAAVQEQAELNGAKIFAWALDLSMRDVTNQQNLANWCQANYLACFLTTNSTDAYNGSLDTDIGAVLRDSSVTCASVFYHDTASEYPEMAYMAGMLSVNYAGVDTVKTGKFKVASSITASSISTTQFNALNAKNYNVVAKTGNVSIFIREGKQSASTWWTDEYIGIQNLREESQVALFNLFLAKKRVPYTSEGQVMQKQQLEIVLQRYVNNGFLADRKSVDNEGNTIILPAYSVVPGNIALATASDRASRIAPPIAVTCYLAGAMHKVTVNVDMIQ